MSFIGSISFGDDIFCYTEGVLLPVNHIWYMFLIALLTYLEMQYVISCMYIYIAVFLPLTIS